MQSQESGPQPRSTRTVAATSRAGLAAGFAAALVGVAAGPSPAVAQTDPIDSVRIEPVEVALTFARLAADGRQRVLAVTAYKDGRVQGIDLSLALGRAATDPVTLFAEEGYEGLRAAIAGAHDAARVSVPASSLTIPVDLGDHHIAAGTNYPDHGDEAGVKDGPFLFTKLVRPTPPRSEVSIGDALLDYEVELAWVTLEPLAEGTRPEALGVLLCNDYTDRALLMRHLDPFDVPSGKGFTTGKSRPGYLPVGDLFVIPRDPRAFAASRRLHLEVDGVVRQESPASAMVWDLDRLLEETWKRRDVRWEHASSTLGLLPDGSTTIPARTLLMAGTPAGTVFQGVALKHQAWGVAGFVFGGWSRPIIEHVAASYASDPLERSRYLQAGNRVRIRVDGLGIVDNRIVP